MYTLLLVDDEALELEALRDFINWEALNIDIVLTAPNGRDALMKVEQNNPDIIITDIKMPIMDGIAFARELQNRGNSAKIIFLSGYDDYQFVHDAYSCGGFDYLLKPFSSEEVSRVILGVEEKLELDRALDGSMETIIRQELEHIFQNDSPAALSSSIAKLHAIPECWIEDSVQIARIYTTVGRNVLQKIIGSVKKYAYCIYFEKSIVVLVRNTISIINILHKIQEELQRTGEAVDGCIFSAQRVPLLELPTQYSRLDSYSPYLFYAENAIEINIDSYIPYTFSTNSLPQIEKQLAQEALFGSVEQTEKMIDDYFRDIISCKTEKGILLETILILVLYFYENYILLNPELMMEFGLKCELLRQIGGMTNITQIRSFIKEYLLKIHHHFCAIKGIKNNDVVISTIRYIHQNFDKPFTVEEFAKIIYLSPNYIRTIFKEKTGKTILEFLTEYRMTKAIELLKDKQFKVKQVSHMVGYDNESYFCAIFLKTNGVSPSEYRKNFYGGI